MARSDNNMGLIALFAFLLGGVIGAGTALLLAPQSGKKTRKQIKDLAEDIKDQAVEYVDELKKRVL